jgi:ABC-type amino acid transport substrate-binding protein
MMRLFTALIITTLLLSSAQGHAQTAESVTLKRIAESGEVRIGFVPDSAPMSYLDQNGNAVGYSIDLCRHIAAAVRDELGLAEIDLSFVPLVSMEDRLKAVENGDVDVECGATTNTLSRRERVDFTLITFITGGAVVSLTGSPIATMEMIAGKSIAVIEGTTTERSLRNYITANGFDVEVEVVQTREEGMEAVRQGRVDGFASDRTTLIGQVFRDGNRGTFQLTQNVFSYEPYAIMLRRGDTTFRLAADRALASLYRTARIRRVYHNWFGRYGEPMTRLIEAMYEFQAVGE